MWAKNKIAIMTIAALTLFFYWRVYQIIGMQAHPSFGVVPSDNYPFLVSNTIGGFSVLLFGFICDRISDTNRRRRLAAGLAFAAAVLTIPLYFSPSYPVFMLLVGLSSVPGYGVASIIIYDMFRKSAYSQRPLVMCGALTMIALVRLPTDLYEQFVSDQIYEAHLLLAVLGAAVLGALLLWLPACKAVFCEPAESAKQENRPDFGKLLLVALVCSVLIYTLFGIYEFLSTGEPVKADYHIIIRGNQIFAPLLAGWLCTKFGRYASIFCSICLTGVGMLMYFFAYTGIWAALLYTCSAFGTLLFSVPIRTLFADMSFFSKRPGLVSSLGLAAFYLSILFGAGVALMMQQVEWGMGMVLYLLVFFISLPAVMLFFHMLQTSYRHALELKSEASLPRLEKRSIDDFGLTKRESEMFLLFIQGQMPAEIAENYFLSESTVKTHLHNIVKKTGVKNRAELVARFHEYSEGSMGNMGEL